MKNDAVLKEFQDAGAILNGHFILSSGLHSDTYLQCARVLMESSRAERLCKALAKLVKKRITTRIDIVVAPAMGGVVVGYEMGRQLGVPAVFCERQDGVFQLRRGFDIPPSSNVLVIEDVVTTGKSSRETYQCILDNGGIVVGEASLVDRSGGKAEETLGVPLVSLMTLEVATFPADALPAHLKDVPAVKPGSRWMKK